MVITHHAYLVRGGEEALPILQEMLGQSAQHYAIPKWGIDDSRELRERQGLQLAPGERRFFILQFASITPEAQNALLKMLEEPTAGNYFFLLASPDVLLLPTLLSRCQVLVLNQKTSTTAELRLALDFLRATPVRRLVMVRNLLKPDDNDEEDDDTLAPTKHLLHQLELVAINYPQDWSALVQARYDIGSPGAAARLILEHLALTLPTLP